MNINVIIQIALVVIVAITSYQSGKRNGIRLAAYHTSRLLCWLDETEPEASKKLQTKMREDIANNG